MKIVRLTRAVGIGAIVGDRGTVLFLSDADAEWAVQEKLAVYIDDGPQSVPPPPPPYRPEDDDGQTYSDESVSEEFLAPQAAEVQPEYEDEPQVEMKRPYGNASKAAWIDWAVQKGADPEQAAALTKNELMSRYGEPL